jgi:hypothetical protein
MSVILYIFFKFNILSVIGIQQFVSNQQPSLVNVYINQRDAQILVNSLYFSLDGSIRFGLSLVHHQEQHLISCTAQSVHAGTSGCSQTYRPVPITFNTTQRF